ncbi:Transcriptional activator FeaR [compost metagenome]
MCSDRPFAYLAALPTRLAQYRRLDFCAESLRHATAEQKLSALGYAWGFTDSSYFSTAFKARFGVSPSEYRKQYSQG